MTEREFARWLDNFTQNNPEFKVWLYKTEDPAAFIAAWCELFSEVEVRDANLVIRRMFRGDDERIKPYDREAAPAITLRYAREQRARRYDAEQSRSDTKRQTRNLPTWSMGESLRSINAAIANGMDRTAACEKFIPKANDMTGPRYDCFRCQDSGYVYIWSEVSIQAVHDKEDLTRRNLRVAMTLCDCSHGSVKISNDESKRKRWTDNHVYDPTRHCLCPNGDVNDEQHQKELRMFVSLLEERLVESMPNYSETLAQYNKGSE